MKLTRRKEQFLVKRKSLKVPILLSRRSP